MQFEQYVQHLLRENNTIIRKYKFIKNYHTDDYDFYVGDVVFGIPTYFGKTLVSLELYDNQDSYSYDDFCGEIFVDAVDMQGNHINIFDCIVNEEEELNKRIVSAGNNIFSNDFMNELT